MLDLYDTRWPIWTYQPQLPPAKFVHNQPDRRGMAIESLVSGGCIISGAVYRSVLFSSVRVHSYSRVDWSLMLPGAQIGRGARLNRVVVDRGCVIPDGMVIGEDTRGGRAALLPQRARHHLGDARHARGARMRRVALLPLPLAGEGRGEGAAVESPGHRSPHDSDARPARRRRSLPARQDRRPGRRHRRAAARPRTRRRRRPPAAARAARHCRVGVTAEQGGRDRPGVRRRVRHAAPGPPARQRRAGLCDRRAVALPPRRRPLPGLRRPRLARQPAALRAAGLDGRAARRRRARPPLATRRGARPRLARGAGLRLPACPPGVERRRHGVHRAQPRLPGRVPARPTSRCSACRRAT